MLADILSYPSDVWGDLIFPPNVCGDFILLVLRMSGEILSFPPNVWGRFYLILRMSGEILSFLRMSGQVGGNVGRRVV